MYAAMAFAPEEFLPLLILATGLALLLRFHRLAATLLLVVVSIAFLPELLGPAFDSLPTWALWALLIFVGFSLLRLTAALLLGQRASEHMIGILAADVVRGLAKGMLRLTLRIGGRALWL